MLKLGSRARGRPAIGIAAAAAFVAAGLGFISQANAQAVTNNAATYSTGIFGTKHNLGNKNSTGTASTSATDQVCVFCHTPHAASSSGPKGVPLWNKKTPDPTTYTVYTSDTLSSTASLQDGTNPTLSVACLSCHDGSLALDTVIYKPAMGGINANGATMGGTWSGVGNGVDANGFMKADANGMYLIGKNLTTMHPVGMRYPNMANPPSGFVTNTEIVQASLANASAAGTSAAKYYVDSSGMPGSKATSGQYNRYQLRLFVRNSDTYAAPYVECASCHDPHMPDWDSFLRVPVAGSAICLSCHMK